MTNNVDISFSYVQNGDCRLHVASLGEGPLVVFCHGFPGLWYSWRNQMEMFANAGYKAVALDMRGYGKSSVPIAVQNYTLTNIRSDLIAVLAHFGQKQATFVGTDFGAAVVWNMALAEPDYVRDLIVFCVPYDHDYYGYFGLSGDGFSAVAPSQRFAEVAKLSFLHAHYFQAPGVAEKELNPHAKEFLMRLFWALSADGDLPGAFGRSQPGMGYMDVLGEADSALPWSWMTVEDMAYYASHFEASGFTGAINWYRVCDLNWQSNREYIGCKINQPCLFIAGQQDPVITMSPPGAIDYMRKMVPNIKEVVLVNVAGHFVQMEQAAEVNKAIAEYLRVV